MTRIPPRFNFGSELKNENPTLYNQLSDIYTLIANVVNSKITKYVTDVDPVSSDVNNKLFDIGDVWINKSTDTAFMMTSRTTETNVTWTQIT